MQAKTLFKEKKNILFSVPVLFMLMFLTSCGGGGETGEIWSVEGVSFQNYVAVATASWPEALAIGDVNNDGRNDVVMTTSYKNDASNDYKLFVFLQNANGTLAAPTKYATSASYTHRPSTIGIGDVNHDGRSDVVIGCSGFGVEVFPQNNAGTLDGGVLYASSDSGKIKIADLNNDGLADIVGIGWGTNTASVWLQDNAGALQAPVVYSVTHGGYDDLDVGDVNHDGLTDVVVMSGQGLVPNLGVLLQNNSGALHTPSYHSVGNNILTHGVATGDVNGDGRNDIVVTYGGNQPTSNIGVFLQNASGLFLTAVSHTSYDCAEPVRITDVNNDGRADIIVLHGGWLKAGVYLQKADGTLNSEALFAIPYATHYNPHGFAVGDINGDGKMDIAIADYNNGLVLLYRQ